MRRLSHFLLLALLAIPARADPAVRDSRAARGKAEFAGPDLEEYLSALERISPSARTGAETYLQAYAGRCGRPLSVSALRRRIADGTGDPVLMQMIRATHPRDDAARARLAGSITCEED